MEKEQYQILFDLEMGHWWYAGMRAMAHALLEGCLGRRQGLAILDAGCGTGGTSQSLARWGRVWGVDLAPEAVALCRKRPKVAVAQGSVLCLPFADDSFDLVTSFDVLYHRAVPEDETALRETWRVLRPGGWLLVRVPAYESLRSSHDEAVHTRHRYTAAELRLKLEAAGFGVAKVSYANTLLFPVAALWRRYQRAQGPPQKVSDLRPTPPLINGLLKAILGAEARLLRHWGLPIGLSVWALARKKLAPS